MYKTCHIHQEGRKGEVMGEGEKSLRWQDYSGKPVKGELQGRNIG